MTFQSPESVIDLLGPHGEKETFNIGLYLIAYHSISWVLWIIKRKFTLFRLRQVEVQEEVLALEDGLRASLPLRQPSQMRLAKALPSAGPSRRF